MRPQSVEAAAALRRAGSPWTGAYVAAIKPYYPQEVTAALAGRLSPPHAASDRSPGVPADGMRDLGLGLQQESGRQRLDHDSGSGASTTTAGYLHRSGIGSGRRNSTASRAGSFAPSVPVASPPQVAGAAPGTRGEEGGSAGFLRGLAASLGDRIDIGTMARLNGYFQ
jgi:hypothetical protein